MGNRVVVMDVSEQRRKWRQKRRWIDGTKLDLREKGLSDEEA